MDIPYSKAGDGSNVQMWFGNNGKNQMFKFEKQNTNTNTNTTKPQGSKTVENGVYSIKSALNENYVMDIYNYSKDNRANLELWTNNKTDNQKFNVKYLENGYYSITAVHSNKSIDVEGNSKNLGANVLQWQVNNQDNQQWVIKAVGNGYYNVI